MQEYNSKIILSYLPTFLDTENNSTPTTIPIIRIIFHHLKTSILFNNRKETIVVENKMACLKEILIFVKNTKFFIKIHLMQIINKDKIPERAKNNVK